MNAAAADHLAAVYHASTSPPDCTRLEEESSLGHGDGWVLGHLWMPGLIMKLTEETRDLPLDWLRDSR